MRVPAHLVAPTLPLFTCVLRAQSTNASLTGRVTDLSKATVAGPIRHGAASRQRRVVQALARTLEAFSLSGNGRGGALFGQAPRPVEPKAVSAKVRAAHQAVSARRGLNAVQADS
jgi:hypothetical protein